MMVGEKPSKYVIGTLERNDIVDSRAALSTLFQPAKDETRERSQHNHIQQAWLREERTDGTLSPILVRYQFGYQVQT